MLFTSYQFIVFVFLVSVLFYCVPKKWQTLLLLLASYYFYFSTNSGYLLYVIITTVSTYLIANKISSLHVSATIESKDKVQRKTEIRKRKLHQKRWLILCLCINVGILCLFKYTNFIIFNFNVVWHDLLGYKQLDFLNLFLPLGISFYTFQSIGYLIDVYRGKYKSEKNYVRFSLFVSFFPQLIQGPISRYDDLSKTLYTEKSFDCTVVSSGLQRILWGYFKKLVVADRILIAVNTIIQSPEQYQGAYVLLGALFYAVELFADFTGGIDITIGIAEIFGIQISENFKRPFFSKSVKEYWTRWHISMGTWFRDYVFYPLSVCSFMKMLTSFSKKKFGKKFGKKVPVYTASFFVWFLTGLWHGATWNFIVWGLGNFVIILISEECRPLVDAVHRRFSKLKYSRCFQGFQIIRTILIMSCLRMFDCYRSVSQTCSMFCSMFTSWDSRIFMDGSLLKLGLEQMDYWIILAGIMLMIYVSLKQRKESVRAQIRRLSLPYRFLLWYGLFLIVLLFGAYGTGYDATQFIYNQY